MVLKVYATPMSTCSRRVATVLYEKKIPFELIKIDIAKGEQKAPEYVKFQPFGQVPYIDDDGFILYESRAITYYLAHKYAGQGNKLIPDTSDIKAHALYLQAASIEVSHFNEYVEKAVAEGVFKKFRGGTPDQAIVDGHLANLKARLAAYDVILSKQKYLAGDEVTLADLWHLPYGNFLALAGSKILDESEYVNVLRWWKDINARPSWQAVKGGFDTTLSYD